MTVTEDLWTLRLAYIAQCADMTHAELIAERRMLSTTDGNHAERLALVRAELRRRTWTRVRPGVYRCGPFVVERVATGEWYACGPGGIDRVFDHKAEAQAACAAAERARAVCDSS